MASQVSHIVYADQYLQRFPAIASKDEFLLGVLFPDIRRVSNLTREQSHQNFKELDLRIDDLTSFEFGWKFHVWCDLRRNELLRDHHFYDIPEIKQCSFMSYYFLEDALVWQSFRNWETVYNICQNPTYIRSFPNLTKSDWVFWYRIVGDYLKQQPDETTIDRFCKLQPSVATKAKRIIDEMEILRKNKQIVDILSGLYLEMIV